MTIVSCDWLEQNQHSPDIIILDASMAPAGTSEKSTFTKCIPGAVRFDIDEFSNSDVSLPHTLLDPDKFQIKAQELGVNARSKIIVYDSGMYSAPRAWWNFKIMGHEDVFVLNGGLTAWTSGGRSTEDSHRIHGNRGNFLAKEISSLVATTEDLLEAIGEPSTRIIDVRKAERYTGQEEEPRPGLRKGHIPSSINIPFTDFLDGPYLRDKRALQERFEVTGCAFDTRLIFSCGSGITACIGLLAAYVSGFGNVCLYDGSWAEWGANPSLPIE